MRRLLFVCMILAMITSAATAGELSFGAKGGLATYTITQIPTGWDNTSFKPGFAGGVFLNYAFSENISLQPEVLYVMKGFKGAISNPFVIIDFEGKYDYIDIPILVKYSVPTKSGFIPCFFVGANLGFNLTSDITLEGEDQITDERFTGSIDYSNATNKTDFGIVIGAGCDYTVGGGRIVFDGRFNLGFSKTMKGGEVSGQINGEPYRETVTESDAKNIGFLLLLGYAF